MTIKRIVPGVSPERIPREASSPACTPLSHQPNPLTMRPSVCISTYNQPQWLEKTLWGYVHQTYRRFELVIADDGSTAATGKVIREFRARFDMPIKHVWHEDQGFRKCRILNQAITAAEGDYLIFSDGDCIPRADFVDSHVRHARPGVFLSGGYFRLTREVSHLVALEQIESGLAFDPWWLVRQGMSWSIKFSKLVRNCWITSLLNRYTTTLPTWNGHNASTWKSDLLAVNGFDERMRYGGEDRELGERLLHAGLCPRQLRYSAICLHLEHNRAYATAEAISRNRCIWDDTRRTGRVQTLYGIISLAEIPPASNEHADQSVVLSMESHRRDVPRSRCNKIAA